MKTQAAVAPVRKEIVVERPLAEAFRLFTREIATWWPLREHAVGAGEENPAVTVVFEEREGGKVYERRADGGLDFWADVIAWEPPVRFLLAWQPNPEAPAATEVEVVFTPESETRTRVELEHRGWERLGERSELARTEYETGWDNVLGRYVGRDRENGAAITSFVLGLVSLVIPFVAFVGAPVAFVFGLIGRRRAARGARHAGLATAGIVLAVVAFLVWGVLALTVVMASVTDGDADAPIPVETLP